MPVYSFGDTHALAAFSPGGDRVAIAGEDRLVVIRLTDLKMQVLDQRDTNAPTWSHDGEYIAYRILGCALTVTPFDGRGERVEIASRIWDRPFWSPTGQLYYSDGNQINSVLSDGSARRLERDLTEWIIGKFEVLEWK